MQTSMRQCNYMRRLITAYLRFFSGSSAGAGSGEFHVYRGSRRREYNRLRFIEEQAKKVRECL